MVSAPTPPALAGRTNTETSATRAMAAKTRVTARVRCCLGFMNCSFRGARGEDLVYAAGRNSAQASAQLVNFAAQGCNVSGVLDPIQIDLDIGERALGSRDGHETGDKNV